MLFTHFKVSLFCLVLFYIFNFIITASLVKAAATEVLLGVPILHHRICSLDIFPFKVGVKNFRGRALAFNNNKLQSF